MTSKNSIPEWSDHFISIQGVEAIEKKIAEIESKTTGEIVVLVVKKSSFIRFVHPVLFLILGVTSLGILSWYLHELWFTPIEAIGFYLVDLIGSYLFALGLSKVTLIQRVLSHPLDMNEAFYRRAISEYYENSLQQTKNNTAVLIMVSLLERKAIVLASIELDKNVDEKLWEQCVSAIIKGAKIKKLGEGILQALDYILPILVSKYPLISDNDNPNEIPNTVLFKD